VKDGSRVAVVIPALNEEEAIGRVIGDIPDWVDDVIVADNGSTDGTIRAAQTAGARVVLEPRPGYGSACLAGIAAVDAPDVVVFIDGDYSDHPEEMERLVDPIIGGEAGLVIGSRALGKREQGALTPQARVGNWLAVHLIRLFWQQTFTDLGPFRAVRYGTLMSLGMCDRDFGWTVEMQVRAAQLGVRCAEVPVSYRRRIGESKISGTISGVIRAGAKILYTIFKHAMIEPRRAERERIVVFSRYPEPGRAKTRLIPELGKTGAADLHAAMAERMVWLAYDTAGAASVEVRTEGGDSGRFAQWLGTDLMIRPQGEGDLGARMARAFESAGQEGIARTIIVGTDCPGITPGVIRRALDELSEYDVVLGPARDGGYYLVGLNRPTPELFDGPEWGTGDVLQQTLEVAARLGLSVALLDDLDDVDRPEDLAVWDATGASREPMRLSIIIPTLNEADLLRGALASIKDAYGTEVIVVDGGSADGTVEVARRHGATVISCEPGRARQMNTGAEAATGDVLLFLHADTRLPLGFRPHVLRALARPDTVAGAFEFRTDHFTSSMRFVESVVNWRSRRLQMPYGDQAVFVRAETFRDVGGFPDIPLMEDLEFIRRARMKGRIAIAAAPAMTSGRRWRKLGVWKTVWLNWWITAAYLLGFDPERLARWYSRDDAKSP
jgi:uncharacterized protein